MSLAVTLDVSHNRHFKERLSLLCSFDEWSPGHRENTWTDPITKTTILTPTCYQDAWRTTHTGNYRRLKKADFYVGGAFADNGNAGLWYDHNRGINEGDWIISNRTTNDQLFTKDSWAANTGFYCEFVAVNAGTEKFLQFEMIWVGPSTSSTISLSIYSDGSAEVSRGGNVISTGNIKGGQAAGSTGGETIGISVMPWRYREIHVLSSGGSGFTCPLQHLEDDQTGQVILPAGKFSVNMPNGSASVQVSPIRYATEGFICSRGGIFRVAPEADRVVETHGYVIGDAEVRLVETDSVGTDFTPDGVKRVARIRVELSGAGTSSPFLIGARGGLEPVGAFTTAEDTEILDQLTKISIDVPDDPAGLRMQLEYKPSTDPAETLRRINASNRPLRVSWGNEILISGVTEPCEYTLRNAMAGDKVKLEARDYSKSLENFKFKDEFPLDGMSLADAFRFVAESAGELPGTLVLDAEMEDFVLPFPDGDGFWNFLISVGDEAWAVLLRLWNTYCASFYFGYKPTATGYALHCIDYVNAIHATLYQTIAEAEAGGGIVYQTYDERKLEPEANVINVTGLDGSSGRPIFVTMSDERSIDPRIPVDQRPDNWLGEPRDYGFGDPAINTLAVAERCTIHLYKKLSWCRYLAEIDSQAVISEVLDLPVWKADLIYLDNKGVYRVVGFSMDVILENENAYRKCKYSLEFVRTQP